jgi:nicotinate-nucleotide adenylyltransferase
MLELALESRPQFSIDTHDLRSVEPTYTINTLGRIRDEVGPARPMAFLIGADQLMAFDRWRDWQQLLELSHFGVAARPGHPIDPGAMSPALAREFRARQAAAHELASRPGGHICVFPITPLDISSSGVREAIAAGRPPGELLPARVLGYIESNGLYASP